MHHLQKENPKPHGRPMIPRIDAPPHADRRYRLRPGAYAILPHEGGILLTVQWDARPDIQLPGGGIDPGETALPALHREVREETGWRIARPVRLGAFRRFAYMPEYDLWAEKLCHVYLARPTRCLGAPSEPGHEALWLPIEAAIDSLGNDGDRMFLRRYASSSGRPR